MLGFDVSERTVLRWMRKALRDQEPGKRWAAFLNNHREAIAAMERESVLASSETRTDAISPRKACRKQQCEDEDISVSRLQAAAGGRNFPREDHGENERIR